MRWCSIRILFVLFCISLPVIGGEIFIRLALSPSKTEKLELLARLQAAQDKTSETYHGPYLGRFIGHPYWGHQMNPGLPGVNNFGFPNTPDIPYAKKPSEFVIGVFGGSVATQAYLTLRDTLEKTESLRCGRQLKILNFANEGYGQPAQYHVATYFIENLDATLNIDGNNEIMATNRFNIPSNYPYFYHETFLITPDKDELLKKAYHAHNLQQFIVSTVTDIPNIIDSDLVYFLVFRLEGWLELKKQLYLAKAGDITPTRFKTKTRRERLYEGLQSWEKHTLLQHRTFKAMNIPAYFFLQPSQYSPEPKMFTEEERRTALHADPEKYRIYKLGFSELRTSGLKMKQQGVDIVDLISLFSQNSANIFVDHCCHLNQRGNEILAQAITKEVVARVNKIPCR